jgi:hypothetical protein
MAEIETEAVQLGIYNLGFARKNRTWLASAFGPGQVAVGEGDSLLAAYQDLIFKFRLRAQQIEANKS